MKLRLFLFLLLACTLLAGRAIAQGCSTNPIKFPDPGAADKLVPSGTCIANADGDSPTGQGGRLRWDQPIVGGSTHGLRLYDSDGGGTLLWCANNADNAGGSSGPSNCLNHEGSILCLQQDGNMVIYVPAPGGPSVIDCNRRDNDGGQPVWHSATDLNNNVQQQLLVAEEVPFCPLSGGACTTLHGDRAALLNCVSGYIWVSAAYND